MGYTAAEMLFYRAFVQTMVGSLSLMRYYSPPRKLNSNAIERVVENPYPKLQTKQILAIIGRGIFGAFSTLTYFQATTMTPVGNVVTLKGLAAVFTSFAGFLILGDPLTKKHGLALFMAVIAAVLITQPPMIFAIGKVKNDDFLTDELPGYLVAMSSALFQCGVYICIKLAVGAPAALLMVSQGMWSMNISALTTVCLGQRFHGFSGDDWKEYVCILGICSVGYVSQWTLTRGGQLLIAGLASLMRATDIAWSFLWSVVFFNEVPNYLTCIGGVTMFGAVFMVSLEKVKKAVRKITMSTSRSFSFMKR